MRIPTVEGDIITIDPRTAHKVVDKGYNSHGKRYWLNKSDYSVKLEAAAHIDELISASAAQHDGAVIGNTKDRTNKKVKAENGWKYRTAYFKNSNGDTYKINISIAQDGEIELAYSIGKPGNKKITVGGNITKDVSTGSKAAPTVTDRMVPQSDTAVNNYSMRNSDIDAQGELSLLDTLPQEKPPQQHEKQQP